MLVMDGDWQERTRLLLGESGVARLAGLRVLVAGVGGVGGHVAEALARAGVGRLVLVDMDRVAASNRNRQVVALRSTEGQAKALVMAERIADIAPECQVTPVVRMVCHDWDVLLQEHAVDVVVDAIDSLNCKVSLLETAHARGVTLYSSMGAGRRMNPSLIRLADVMDTSVCGLARQVRQRLRKAGVGRGAVRCVFSTELPAPPGPLQPAGDGRARTVNGTISYMPALFGLMLAGDLLQQVIQGDSASQ